MDLSRFLATYPVAWHVTRAENAERIIETRRVECAADLMRAAGDESYLRRRREREVSLDIAGRAVVLSDQAPLHAGAGRYVDGWTFERLVEEINNRVFFWPGSAREVTARAKENCAAFRRRAGTVTMRIPTAALREACAASGGGVTRFQVTAVNTGALRSHPRTGLAERGPRTFTGPGAFDGTPARVQEIAVLGSVRLDDVWPDVQFD